MAAQYRGNGEHSYLKVHNVVRSHVVIYKHVIILFENLRSFNNWNLFCFYRFRRVPPSILALDLHVLAMTLCTCFQGNMISFQSMNSDWFCGFLALYSNQADTSIDLREYDNKVYLTEIKCECNVYFFVFFIAVVCCVHAITFNCVL